MLLYRDRRKRMLDAMTTFWQRLSVVHVVITLGFLKKRFEPLMDILAGSRIQGKPFGCFLNS
jgi:hypothetical protein